MAGAGSDDDVDHYSVLGLPSGQESFNLTLKEIEKAYRNQSRIRHPDKRPDDPNATADFQRLTSSFEVLRDDAKRAVFDAKIRARLERILRDSKLGVKRRKLAADLDERERAAAARGEVDEEDVVRRREKSVAAEMKRELEEFQARKAKKVDNSFAASASGQEKVGDAGGVSVDKEKVLKVSWDREMGNYSSVELREIFERFGGVEDVVIRSKKSKKSASAIVVMSSKDAAVAATKTMSGSISNPLLVLLLQPGANNIPSTSPAYNAETINPKSSNVAGTGFQDYEASILKKLEKEPAALVASETKVDGLNQMHKSFRLWDRKYETWHKLQKAAATVVNVNDYSMSSTTANPDTDQLQPLNVFRKIRGRPE